MVVVVLVVGCGGSGVDCISMRWWWVVLVVADADARWWCKHKCAYTNLPDVVSVGVSVGVSAVVSSPGLSSVRHTHARSG